MLGAYLNGVLIMFYLHCVYLCPPVRDFLWATGGHDIFTTAGPVVVLAASGVFLLVMNVYFIYF